jgi:hypothetical protein
MTNPAPAERYVTAGAALLDLYGPFLWRSKVDRETLAIPSSYDCVLGQLYGSFGEGVAAILQLSDVQIDHWIYVTGFMPSFMANASQLRFAWIRQLPPSAPLSLRRAA